MINCSIVDRYLCEALSNRYLYLYYRVYLCECFQPCCHSDISIFLFIKRGANFYGCFTRWQTYRAAFSTFTMNVVYSHPLAFLSCFKSINSLANQGSSTIIYHSVTANISIPVDFIKLQDLGERNNEGRNIKRIFGVPFHSYQNV